MDHVCEGLQFCIPDPTVPRAVHVAFAGDTSRMAVSWLTYRTPPPISLRHMASRLSPFAYSTPPPFCSLSQVPTNTSVVQWSLSPNGTVVGTASGMQTTYLISYTPPGPAPHTRASHSDP